MPIIAPYHRICNTEDLMQLVGQKRQKFTFLAKRVKIIDEICEIFGNLDFPLAAFPPFGALLLAPQRRTEERQHREDFQASGQHQEA